MRKKVVYARLSEDKEGAGLAIERQHAEVLEHFGLPADTDLYSDNDISASDKRKKRPAYQRLIADIADGKIEAVYCWHTDRLWRRSRELEDLLDALDETGIVVHAKQAGVADLSTPGGRAMTKIGVTIAQQEVELKSERQKAKNLQLAKSGQRYVGGSRLFGYGKDMTVIPEEAEAVRYGVASLLAGGTLYGIAQEWNRRGLVGVRGRPFNADKVRSVLRSPMTCGLRVYKGQEYQGVWQPIVSEVEWRGVVATLADPSRRKSSSYAKHLLTGIAICSKCDRPVYSGWGHSGRRYICRAHHIASRAEPLDQYIHTSLVLYASHLALESRWDIAAISRLRDSKEVHRLETRASALRSRMAEVKAMLTEPDSPLSVVEIQASVAKLQGDLAAVESEMEGQESSGLETLLRGVLDVNGSNLDQERGLLQALTTRVELSPSGRGRTRDPHRLLSIDWQYGPFPSR